MAKRFTLKRTLFVRHPEEDFNDDGNEFRIYYYKDKLPISVCTYDGDIYLAMRPDYLGYNWKDYQEDYKVLDKYNGVYNVYNIDKEQLEEDCEAMYQKYCVEKPAQIEEAVSQPAEEAEENNQEDSKLEFTTDKMINYLQSRWNMVENAKKVTYGSDYVDYLTNKFNICVEMAEAVTDRDVVVKDGKIMWA